MTFGDSPLRFSENMGVIHFVGVGGVGMSGIAEVLLNLGCSVQGSDLSENAATARLRSLGARVFIGHRAEHLHGCDVVVVSSAVSPDNAEVRAAVEASPSPAPTARRRRPV